MAFPPRDSAVVQQREPINMGDPRREPRLQNIQGPAQRNLTPSIKRTDSIRWDPEPEVMASDSEGGSRTYALPTRTDTLFSQTSSGSFEEIWKPQYSLCLGMRISILAVHERLNTNVFSSEQMVAAFGGMPRSSSLKSLCFESKDKKKRRVVSKTLPETRSPVLLQRNHLQASQTIVGNSFRIAKRLKQPGILSTHVIISITCSAPAQEG